MSVFRVGIGSWLPGDRFCSIDKAEKIRAPTYVFHGTNDQVIPVEHGKAIYAKLQMKHPAWWVDGAGHNDIEYGWWEEYTHRIKEFIDALEVGRS